MRILDVVVVGGGPAGLYAGWQLASSGHQVTLLEEHAAIGAPVHCTGVLANEAFEEFDLDRSVILNQLRSVRFHAPSGEVIQYRSKKIEAVAIDRLALDRSLARRAVGAGVRVVHGRATSVTPHRDGVTVQCADAAFRARVCVLACGAHYALQRRLGLGIPNLLLLTAQAEMPAERLGDVEVYFGRRFSPGGFAWAVPVQREGRGFVRVGVMCDGHSGRHFHRVLGHLRALWGIPQSVAPEPRQKVLPLEPIARTYTDRIIVVGDAAGLVKPTTGGGIYYSLVSARLAARALIRGLERDELGAWHLADYQSGWKDRLGPELSSQLALRRVAQGMTDEDINGMFELARTDGITPLIQRTAAFNQHRPFIVALLKHPPARRLLFKAVVA
jgi:geranylgeranyl reductase family protein